MAPLISVIIPCFNAQDYLEETIESVLKQTYSNFEVLVIDDGSTDDSVEKLENFKDDITLIKQSNQGVSAARNNGVEHAKGQWVSFLDADDIWFPNKLEVQMENIKDNVWSHTNSIYFGENQKGDVTRQDLTPQYSGMVFKKLIINNFITTSSVLIRKDVFKDSGGFDESLSALEDWKLWASLSKMYYLKYQETPLMKYRVYNFSTSRNARKILPIHCKVIGHIFDTICTTDPLYKYRKEALSESYFICSYIAEESSDFSFSFFCSLRSYYFQPLKFKAFKRVLSSFKNLITSNFK